MASRSPRNFQKQAWWSKRGTKRALLCADLERGDGRRVYYPDGKGRHGMEAEARCAGGFLVLLSVTDRPTGAAKRHRHLLAFRNAQKYEWI